MIKNSLKIAFFLMLLPSVAYGATVINNVSSSANTGGGSTEGEARASIKIYTEVNSQVVENFDKEVVSQYGTASVEVKTETKVDESGEINSQSEIEVSGEEILAEKEAPKTGVNVLQKILTYVFRLFTF